MKIICVSAFAPSRSGLNEYLYLLLKNANQFQATEFIVLADRSDESLQELIQLPNVKIRRVWQYNKYLTPLILLNEILKEKPDVIWFNLLLSTFGDKLVSAFLGMLTPILCRIAGFRVCTTLHHLIEFMDVSETKFSGRGLIIKGFALFVQQILVLSGTVALLLNKYVNHVNSKYFFARAKRFHHGFPSPHVKIKTNEENTDNKDFNILVFGKFGSYKRLDFAAEVFAEVSMKHPNARLTIAGSSHPSYPSYYENFSRHFKYLPNVTFKGYLNEESLNEVFSKSHVVFLPYSSATGVSGVAHIAASYGLPIVAPDIEDFRAMELEEGVRVKFFTRDSIASAADSILSLALNSSEYYNMSMHNLSASSKGSFEVVLRSYIEFFSEWMRTT